VAKLPGLERLRFITPHPKDIAPELIRAFAALPTLAPRLHLPLQSGSDRMLTAMGRKYTREKYLDIIFRLREARPGLQFSTDIIVGFPGETEEDFADTLLVMGKANFAASFSFAYSDRPGTAASLLKNKIPRKEALVRLSLLQDWQNKNTERTLKSMLGNEARVIIEGKSLLAERPADPKGRKTGHEAEEGSSWHGRDEYGTSVNIPVKGNLRVNPGDMVRVKITGCGKHTLKGELAIAAAPGVLHV
jgi:tRNA-2-methylthio-N6-dimethylallyladenosine synthase